MAPSARLYAVTPSQAAAPAREHHFNILRASNGLRKGVRVINMSFRPARSSMERALKAAHDKGIVLIAAAGNAGEIAAALTRAPYPNVIA